MWILSWQNKIANDPNQEKMQTPDRSTPGSSGSTQNHFLSHFMPHPTARPWAVRSFLWFPTLAMFLPTPSRLLCLKALCPAPSMWAKSSTQSSKLCWHVISIGKASPNLSTSDWPPPSPESILSRSPPLCHRQPPHHKLLANCRPGLNHVISSWCQLDIP